MIRPGRFPPYVSLIERIWHYIFHFLCYGILLYLVLPIIVIIPLSFKEGGVLIYPIEHFTFHWYQVLFRSPTWIRAIENSFIIAPCAMVLATILGTLCALGLHNCRFRGKRLLIALLVCPIISPLVVVGLGMYLFQMKLGLAGTYIGLIIAHSVLGAPLVLITVGATLTGLDPALPKASMSLSAGPVETFFRIILPLIAPGVLSGALFAFSTSFDEVIVTLFLASPMQTTIPLQMFTGLRNSITPVIVALATLLIVFSGTLILLVGFGRNRSLDRRRGAAGL